MTWELEYLPEAQSDLDNSIRQPVIKGIKKVQQNPVSKEESGYGTLFGNKEGNNLTGLFKIKFLKYDTLSSNKRHPLIICCQQTSKMVK